MCQQIELEDFWRHSNAARPPLRIGLLLPGTSLPRFEAAIVRHIVRSNFARIELLIFNKKARKRISAPRSMLTRAWSNLWDKDMRRTLAYRLYDKCDRHFIRLPNHPLDVVDCSDLLAGIGSITVDPATAGLVQEFPPDAIDNIRGCDLDVILRFGFASLHGDILRASRYGIWSYQHGDNEYLRGGPPLFWELCEHRPVCGMMLQILTEELDPGYALCKAWFPTELGISVHRAKFTPYWGASALIIQKLHELHQYGWEFVQQHQVPNPPYRGKTNIYDIPTNLQICKWFFPRLAKRAVLRNLRPAYQWRIALRSGHVPLHHSTSAPSMEGFEWLEAPRGHFYADPFLIQAQGKTWLFFEDFIHCVNRGVLACAEILPGNRMGAPHTILAEKYHLSYPCVFEHDGVFYMIPESYQSSSIDLYRAVKFPYRWRKEATLLGASAVDTTVWKQDGLFWFFTTIRSSHGRGLTLLLFYSHEPAGEWIYHPANPISMDIRNARSGGPIFRADGELFRVSQDGGVIYGHSFTLHRITKLTPTEFAQEPVVTIDPSWAPGQIGTHTYSTCTGLEATDDCIKVKRSWAMVPAEYPPEHP